MAGRKGDPSERELIRIAIRSGCTVRRSGNNHVIIYLPAQRPVIFSMGGSRRERDTSKITKAFKAAGLL